MASSINSYLRQLSSEYYLKTNSDELEKINKSIANLYKNLENDLGVLIKRKFIFGSFDRDTILPRKFDLNSDVDIMIVFNHTDYERTPETYRGWLKLFADKYYKDRYGSEVYKSFPTVTIKLNNIKYDLVPAKEETTFYNSQLYIPNNIGWQKTNPNDVKENLLNVNKQYNYIVKPIIRLLKAWNSKAGNPLDSYELELQVTKMNFYNDNIESGFFWGAKNISVPYYSAQWKKDKIAQLAKAIDMIQYHLSKDEVYSAKYELHKIIPEI